MYGVTSLKGASWESVVYSFIFIYSLALALLIEASFFSLFLVLDSKRRFLSILTRWAI